MQFEQTAELNRLVDATIPLTWAVRWKAIRPVLPMLACCSVLLVEQVAFRLWLNDRNFVAELPLLFACLMLPGVLVTLASEVQVRISHRSKRRIRLEPKRISITPAKCNRIPWKQVAAWRLEPLPHSPGFSKLTVEYSLAKGGKRPREWSMVLRQADQEHALLSELEYFRQKGSTASPVVRLNEPPPPRASNRRLRSMGAAALGLYLLLHGLPLLGVGLLPPDRGSHETRSSQFTSKETAKLRRFVLQTFASVEEFRRVMLAAAGGLTIMGAGLYFWGLFAPKRPDALAVSESATSADATPATATGGSIAFSK